MAAAYKSLSLYIVSCKCPGLPVWHWSVHEVFKISETFLVTLSALCNLQCSYHEKKLQSSQLVPVKYLEV